MTGRRFQCVYLLDAVTGKRDVRALLNKLVRTDVRERIAMYRPSFHCRHTVYSVSVSVNATAPVSTPQHASHTRAFSPPLCSLLCDAAAAAAAAAGSLVERALLLTALWEAALAELGGVKAAAAVWLLGSASLLSAQSGQTASLHQSHVKRRRKRLNERRHSLQKPCAARDEPAARRDCSDSDDGEEEEEEEEEEVEAAARDDQSLPMKVE